MPADVPEPQSFDFAVYIGESREVQKTLVKAVENLGVEFKEFRAEVKADFGGVKDTVAVHSADIAVAKADIITLKEGQAKNAEAIAPVKLHPIVVTGIILSPVLALAAVVTSVVIAITR